MKISFITTVYNEAQTIDSFLKSLVSQTRLPHEIIVVDGGSTDKTMSIISNFQFPISKKNVKIILKKGNRSVGRNEAIKHANGDIIVCSDSGNILDKDWVKNITKQFKDSSVDVVAGYYKGKTKDVFQKCLLPYVFVMPDKVKPNNFLPATRSMAFTKKIWKKVDGFDERFSHNEDYVFANRLQEKGAKIVFAKDAIVNWIPRKTFKEAFIMFFRFALGDAESGISRSSVLLLFTRYFLGLYLIFLSLLYRSFLPVTVIAFGLLLYLLWSVAKNYQYVLDKKAVFILPKLQFTADAAVLSGTILGVIKRVIHFSYFSYVRQNIFLFFILTVYVSILLLTIQWGIPNQYHPFPYHMDEWHQLEAVANTFRYGTPNTAGSANGTMFNFILSGFYLIPFTLVKFVDPFSLQIDNAFMRERIFEILRLQTVLYGTLSLFVLYKITGLLNVSKRYPLILFLFTPVWLTLSGYFKYDIALLFWIMLSFLFLLRFSKDKSGTHYLLAGVTGGLAIATKVSAIPLFLIYIAAYIWFKPKWYKHLTYLLVGISFFVGVVILFGMPDTLFGKGNIVDYFVGNVASNGVVTQNYKLGMNIYSYLIFVHFPAIFGHGLYLLIGLSLLFWIYTFFNKNIKINIKKYHTELFVFFSLGIFLVSVFFLQIGALGNRSLVLLPFFILVVAITLKKVKTVQKFRLALSIFLSCIILIQIVESICWISVKFPQSPQEKASAWITQHIPKGQTIGLEDIPIYQYEPDMIQREFYFGQYHVNTHFMYQYKIVDSKTKIMPNILILSNDVIEQQLLKKSPKQDLLKIITKRGYKKIAEFSPNFPFNRFFLTQNDYFLSGIVTTPLTISIYKAAQD